MFSSNRLFSILVVQYAVLSTVVFSGKAPKCNVCILGPHMAGVNHLGAMKGVVPSQLQCMCEGLIWPWLRYNLVVVAVGPVGFRIREISTTTDMRLLFIESHYKSD